MGSFGVASGFELISSSCSKSNAEQPDEVSVSSFDVNSGLDEGMPFSNDLAKEISGNVKSVDGGVAFSSFNFLTLKLNLSKSHFTVVLVQISERNLEDSSLK